MQTPVILIIFNRPRLTERVFAEIANAKPRQLFVIADGPRRDRVDDDERCRETRAIIERVDWNCEVYKNYSQVNLGCGRRPATGIGWAFEKVEEAIILEDDCVPHPTFFRFCEELLEKYRNEARVMQIAGTNLVSRQSPLPYSYAFTTHLSCWGWATWRRAWKYHDMTCRSWPTFGQGNRLCEILRDQTLMNYYARFFDLAFRKKGDVDFWDYQWLFACWNQGGLSVAPNRTLITNIGWGPDATHTFGEADKRANIPLGEMVFPLKHPPAVARDKFADRKFIEEVLLPYLPRPESLAQKLHQKAVNALPRQLRATLATARDRLRDL